MIKFKIIVKKDLLYIRFIIYIILKMQFFLLNKKIESITIYKIKVTK